MTGIEDVGRALVVGARVTGRAVVATLRAARVGVVVVDDDPAMLARLEDDPGVEALVVDDPRPLLARVDVVVPSPGVPETSPLLRAAEEAGVAVWSEPELAARLRPDRHLVGVTGTNGKTSVTELVTAMLVAGGVPARACGNIGHPVLAAVAGDDHDVLVAELSSFQLRYASAMRCRAATVLNLAPDHLDWHGGFEPYGAAKARIWAGQHEEDWAVVPVDDTTVRGLVADAPGRVAAFSGAAEVSVGVGVDDGWLVARGLPGEGRIVRVDALTGTAPHLRDDVAAAAALALVTGAEPGGVADAAVAFRPGRHRGEVVAVVDGARFVDDSKATNPHATAAALRGGAIERTVWIGGGRAKGVDPALLAPVLRGARHAVLVGEAAEALRAVCHRADVPTTVVPPGRPEPMVAAVTAAHAVTVPGDRVLLSPACSSLDLFDGYDDRGRRFAAAARALPGARAVAAPGEQLAATGEGDR